VHACVCMGKCVFQFEGVCAYVCVCACLGVCIFGGCVCGSVGDVCVGRL
jgi:hypothetical protein